jgi:hypothetical protein
VIHAIAESSLVRDGTGFMVRKPANWVGGNKAVEDILMMHGVGGGVGAAGGKGGVGIVMTTLVFAILGQTIVRCEICIFGWLWQSMRRERERSRQ